jgi:hypothetical protein
LYLTLREEQRMKTCEKSVLRGIFRPKGDGIPGRERKLHNKEFHNLHASPVMIIMMKLRITTHVGQEACMGR